MTLPSTLFLKQDEKLSRVQHIATQAFDCLPKELKELSYVAVRDNPGLADKYRKPERIVNRPSTRGNGIPIPVSLGPCLKYHSIICREKDLKRFLLRIVCHYIREVKLPKSCELCQRSQFVLTAHHLVPRSVHDIALQQVWHDRQKLNKIAWLCRGCYGFVHRTLDPKTLGKDYWSIKLLLRRTEVLRFAETVGRLKGKIMQN